jgi:RimK family alpha-L-glutamate ligase
MRFGVVAHRPSGTNLGLAQPLLSGVDSALLTPRKALLELRPGDIALARLDVRDELDGVEDGLAELDHLARLGVSVLNSPASLLAAHDKLLTARMLRRAGLPHPRTTLVADSLPWPDLDVPLVLKPRFGSWGRDVFLCRDRDELGRTCDLIARRGWFGSHGALAQELVPPLGFDIRIVVAAGLVIGAARREAACGEWRTNIALGATRTPVTPPAAAVELALAAAAAAGGDLVGVDLLPLENGRWIVLELNGAVDFGDRYVRSGNVYARAVRTLVAAGNPRKAA